MPATAGTAVQVSRDGGQFAMESVDGKTLYIARILRGGFRIDLADAKRGRRRRAAGGIGTASTKLSPSAGPRDSRDQSASGVERATNALQLAPNLLQFRKFCFGLLQDRNVGIGVFPGGQKILIRGPRFHRIALHSIGARQAEPGEHPKGRVAHHPAIINEFLKLCRGAVAVVEHQKSLATQIRRKYGGIGNVCGARQFDGARRFEQSYRELWVVVLQGDCSPDHGKPISLDQRIEREVLVESGYQLFR